MLIAKLEALAADDLPIAIAELVRGVPVIIKTKSGEERVYQQQPNAQMVMYVTDRLLGKMASRTEVTGVPDDDGNAQPIPIILLPPE